MTEADLVAMAEEKGWLDGSSLAPYSPPLTWQVCPDADDAYRSGIAPISGGMMAVAWFVWDHAHDGPPTLGWL